MQSFVSLITAHRAVQQVARTVLKNLAATISAVDTEASIATRAHQALSQLGVPDTWYYDCPVFVLLGTRSCTSISGRAYVPSREPVGAHNLVTVDLSPMRNGHWGDCARSFYVEDGQVTAYPNTPEFVIGKQFLEAMHADMRHAAQPQMTFHDLFAWANHRIAAEDFENPDFLGNVGHSIATRREDRQYIKAQNHCLLGDVPFFTFEPHVRHSGGRWGFKHENIFYFDRDGRLEEL